MPSAGNTTVSNRHAVVWSISRSWPAVRQSRKKGPAPATRCNSRQREQRRRTWGSEYSLTAMDGGLLARARWNAASITPCPAGNFTRSQPCKKSAHVSTNGLVPITARARRCHSIRIGRNVAGFEDASDGIALSRRHSSKSRRRRCPCRLGSVDSRACNTEGAESAEDTRGRGVECVFSVFSVLSVLQHHNPSL